MNFLGNSKVWTDHEQLPACSLHKLFQMYLNITSPPRTEVLRYFHSCTQSEDEKKRLEDLIEVGHPIGKSTSLEIDC
jgi:sulfite reductase alpha subunit-like flavoprotein